MGDIQKYIVSIILGYLLGCLNLAWLLGKTRNVNMKQSGTGNLGASNTTLHLGLKAGVAVAFHDIFKGVIAVLIPQLLFPDLPLIGYVAGASSILGHIFPFWLKFSGGKGFATLTGVILVTDWKIGIGIIILDLILAFSADYIVAATFTSITLYPLSLLILKNNPTAALIFLIISIIMLIKHLENIKRIIHKEEKHLKQTLKGKSKVEKEDREDRVDGVDRVDS